MKNPNYKMSMGALYIVCRRAWENFTANLARFTAYKGFYITGYATDRLEEVDQAEALPGDQERINAAKNLRIETVAKGQVCLDLFQDTKRYIVTAFAPQYHQNEFLAAGIQFFESASGENWTFMRQLNTYMLNYVTAKEETLMENDNMPTGFKTTVTATRNQFDLKYFAFKAAEASASEGTDEKINANNNCYTQMIQMLEDGQRIFKYDDSSLRQQFVLEHLLESTGFGPAGMKGEVTIKDTNTDIAGATITVVEQEKEAASATDGEYEFTQLQSGRVTLRVTAPGFEELVINDVEIEPSTVKRMNFQLTPLS